MFKLFRKQQPAEQPDIIGGFGKLSVHNEFIKYNLLLPELAQIERWYQSGYHQLVQKYGKETKEIITNDITHDFIYFSKSSKPIIGMLQPSHDQSGRAYPFVTFRVLNQTWLLEFPCIIPATYHDFYQLMTELNLNSANQTTLAEVYAKINDLNKFELTYTKSQAFDSALNNLHRVTMCDYWQAISQTDSSLLLSNFIQTLIETIQNIKIKLPESAWLGIKLPLPTNAIRYSALTFWLQLFNTLFLKQDILLQAFWVDNVGANNVRANDYSPLQIFFKPMGTECFINLIDSAATNSNIFDVMTLSKNVINVSDRAKKIADNPQMSLLELLNKL